MKKLRRNRSELVEVGEDKNNENHEEEKKTTKQPETLIVKAVRMYTT